MTVPFSRPPARALATACRAATLVVALAACVPLPNAPRFRPSYAGHGASVLGLSCAGNGPGQLLELRGPAKSAFSAYLVGSPTRRAVVSVVPFEASRLHAHVRLHAAERTRIALLADSVVLSIPRAAGASADLTWAVRLRDMRAEVSRPGAPPAFTPAGPEPRFDGVIEGGGRRGTTVWLDFPVLADTVAVEARRVTMQLPPMAITDRAGTVERFVPALITFTYRTGGWHLMPLNC